MNVAVVDYGMGNLRSVAKALEKVGADVQVTSSPREIRRAQKIVLPGVGSFADAVAELKKRTLFDLLKEEILSGKHFLGLCLGLQLLFTESYEDGVHRGFDILKGKVVRFAFDAERSTLKVPHMGWNRVRRQRPTPLLEGLASEVYFYFVHSYYCIPDEEEVVVGTTDYGFDFASVVQKENLFGTQFHPEKSQADGLKVLENFLRL